MAGERLDEFGLDLCGYVLGQFRSHLRGLPARVVAATRMEYSAWHRLDLPTWLGRAVAGLPAPLADHVWAGVAGDAVERPLTDAELSDLRWAAFDPPSRCEADCVWWPYPVLHRRAVVCVGEIRAALTRRTAEDWADESAAVAARLLTPGLPLMDGIEAVHDWLRTVRRLLDAMSVEGGEPSGVTGVTHTNSGPRSGRRRRQVDAADRGPQAADMISPAAVSARFSISLSTVYAACRSGALPHYRVPAVKGARGKYLLREADVAAWLDSLRVAAGSPTPSASAPVSSGSPAGLFSELDSARLAKAWTSR